MSVSRCRSLASVLLCFFFFNDTATTEIYTLSLHDALPIYDRGARGACRTRRRFPYPHRDRKSTRLNSSHLGISYAVFCLKKKKKTENKIGRPSTRDFRSRVPQCCLYF